MKISVWGRWFILTLAVAVLAYRPADWYPHDIAYVYLLVPLVALNGLVHHRLLTNRHVTWHWLIALSAMDIVVITGHVVVGGGFKSFSYLAYYPAVGMFAVALTSFWRVLACTTVTASAYVVLILTVDSGLDMDGGDLRVIVGRLGALFAISIGLSFLTRFQRDTREAAVERERALQQERIQLSQATHDTTAQSAYMIGLGIDAIRQVAGESNEELAARLEATSRLSKTTIWQLRHPIDAGHIFEGRGLGRTLDSHVSTFTSVTSVPAELIQSGEEPPLSKEVRSQLFTIAHSALTNTFHHAGAGRVLVNLDFGQEEIRLSVSDDGVGLPEDYEDRGHGFANMRTDAERLGGRLIVEPRGPDGGARVTCVTPLGRRE